MKQINILFLILIVSTQLNANETSSEESCKEAYYECSKDPVRKQAKMCYNERLDCENKAKANQPAE